MTDVMLLTQLKLGKISDGEPKYTFETGIKETIQWYLDNPDWMDQVKSGEYQEYYKKCILNKVEICLKFQ